jgi:hypothetical protein
MIGKSLGHRSESATRVYARLATDPVRESVEKATMAMITGPAAQRLSMAEGLVTRELDRVGCSHYLWH